MSKSILIIDTPKTCEDCPCMNWTAYGDEILCGVLGEELFIDSSGEVIKSKRCPLKPMPKKKDGTFRWTGYSDEADESYLHGWNDCLEEIERVELEPKSYSCPEWVEALLWEIDSEMARVHLNVFQKEMDSPFQNTGNKYSNPVFEVSAYSWNDDDEDEVNFRYKDIEISWYKHLGRCTEININPKVKGFNEKMIDMFDECMKAVREGDLKW